MRLDWGTAPISALQVLELLLTLLCVGIAFLRPGFAGLWFSKVEDLLWKISRRPWLCILILAFLPILLRLLILPVYGAPAPFISDEYAYLLQADTFASGRLTNPTPPLADHFDSVYVFTRPTYTAEYQVAQGLLLAAGRVLFGSPWAGVMASMGLLCVLTYWALLGWLPRVWAFTGTLVILDLQLGVLSYWMNSYWGGCVPGIGGALVLGALARLREAPRVRYSFILSGGVVVLMNSRPLEGILLGLLAAGAVLYWIIFARELTFTTTLTQILAPAAITLIAALIFIGYYNYRVTGRAAELPYLLYRDRYGVPQGFFWQKPRIVNTPLPSDIQAEYEDQLQQHERRKSPAALALATGGKLRRFWNFYIGVPLTLTLIFAPFIWRERNMGLALGGLVLVLVLDNMTFFAYFPHYSAAVIALIVLALVQCIRRLRAGGRAGKFLSRSLPLVCALGLAVPLCGRLMERLLPAPLSGIEELWASEFERDLSREIFVPRLEREPGRQLVLVRYKPWQHQKKKEWIYNSADIDASKIVWARESDDPASNRALLRYFAGRTVWLGEPDATPPRITRYRAPAAAP